MSVVQVLLVWPALETASVSVGSWSNTGEAGSQLSGGLLAVAPLFAGPRASLLGQVGFRGYTAGMRADELEVRGWAGVVELEAVERWGAGGGKRRKDEPGVFWEIGLGPHVALFGGDWWGLHVNPALDTHTALGGVIGRGPLRGVVQLRGTATVRTDSYSGDITTGADTFD